MKHPLWIANSSLLVLTICALFFIYLSRVELPEREDIDPQKSRTLSAQLTPQINIAKIYENDLFGTYQKEMPAQPEEVDFVAAKPAPPEPRQVAIPPLPKPQFLDPLDVTLKGIVVISNDSAKNKAIIMNNKTTRDDNYRIGDTIEDAQLIRIFSNKIILLRSNGQQEILYLREEDAKKDPSYMAIEEWEKVAKQTTTRSWLINVDEFLERVTSLAQIIDILGMTTGYKKGVAVGVRLGQQPAKSLGMQLGLQTGDTIMSINNIPTTSTENRLAIYNTIIGMEDGDTVVVLINRKGRELEYEYTLKQTFEKPLVNAKKQEQKKETQMIQRLQEQEKSSILKEQYKLAPTVEELRKKEREMMRTKGKMPVQAG